ncbi:hypothetical protein [Streptomyces sp. NPDC048496]|uniref:hypothetical protein n=1 Tax=Streptomyces sp. NPDC048496 TaxID=3365558 RepID=UPI00371B0963
MAADARNATWIGWDELKTVDWDEPAVASDARMTRREAVPVDGDWKPVWTVMETLAAIHGDTNVRLAAWFD